MSSRALRRIGLAAAALAVIALAAALALRLYSTRRLERAIERFESEAGSLDLATYAPPPVEDRSRNAALWLQAGAQALLLDPEQNRLIERRIGALGEPWTAADAEAFAALRAEHDPARGLMHRAAGLDRSSFEIDYGRGAEADLPDFLALLRAGRILAVECDFELQRGRLEPALAALHLLERLTAVQRAESALIALLAGAAVERLYHDRLEAILQVVEDEDTLRRLRRDLDHLDAATVAPQRPFAADTAAVIPWVLRHAGEWPDWAGPEPASGLLPNGVVSGLSTIGLGRAAAAMVLEIGVRTVQSVEVPAAAIDPAAYAREVMMDVRSPVPYAARLARVLAPNYLHAIRREQWVRSARALGRLALDLRLSRAGHGAYPRPPIDLPVSAATGETAVYRILEDGGVEVVYPETEASWDAEDRRADKTGKISSAKVNLRWRLPG